MIHPTIPLPVVGALTSADIGVTVMPYDGSLAAMIAGSPATAVFTYCNVTFYSMTSGDLTVGGNINAAGLQSYDPNIAGDLWVDADGTVKRSNG